MTMTFARAMAALEARGSEQTRETYRRHGACEPWFGVQFGALRPLAKRIGNDHVLRTKAYRAKRDARRAARAEG